MNVEVNAGRGGTSRRSTGTDDAARGGMDHQVLPFEIYDSARAKVAANLHWLFARAFGPDDIPSDLQDPFYTDQYEQEHIKPPITHLLLSAELYCRVCDVTFQPSPLQNHKSVIQALSRKGLYILDDNETLVSEMDLTSTPIKMSFHIQLIDTLMTAYTEEMISIEKVVSTVKCFVETSDSMALPFDLEDAMMFWINKVMIKLRGSTQKEPKMKHLLETACHQKGRYRKDQLCGHPHPHLPILDNLSSFVCVGTSLLAVVHFYCPELIRLEDICLKDIPSTAESLSNIHLLMDFSDEFLNKCIYLKPEDMLYSPPALKINIMQIIAEMFWIFEVVKPDFMQPRDIHENKDVRKPQSSNTMKQRFWTSDSENTITRSTGLQRSLKACPNSSLLPPCEKEQTMIEDHTLGQRNWSSSLGYGQETRNVASPRKRQRPLSQIVPYALHFPMKEDADSICLPHSISKDSLSSNFLSTPPRHMLGSGDPRKLSGCTLLNYRFEDEEEEIEEEELVAIISPTTLSRHRHQSETEHRVFHSVSPSRTKNTHGSFGLDRYPISTERSVDKYFLEPLIPAIPKPAKEKSVLVNKEVECGESGSKGSLTVRRSSPSGSCAPHRPTLLYESKSSSSAGISLRAVTQGCTDTNDQDNTKESDGFFLHLSEAPKDDSPLSSLEASNVSDSVSFSEDSEDELQLTENMTGSQRRYYKKEQTNFGEGESIKLGEDQKVTECDDKEDHSGCLSLCHSSGSWSSSGTGVKMTSFAEKKLLKLGQHGGPSSTNSTPRTTPDDSEASLCLPWQMKNSGSTYSLGKETCKESRNITETPILTPSSVVPVELLELHMQLEERRHAIECQKKKVETLSAQQRLKLGKTAFLNIVKKEPRRCDTLPLPIKQESSELRAANQREVKIQNCKDDSYLEDLKIKTKLNEGAQLIINNEVCQDSGQCLHSIDVLNEAISSIQQQIMQLSLQQDILIKHRSVLPLKCQTNISTTPCVTATTYHTKESEAFVVNFQKNDDSSSASLRWPPKLSSSQRKASNQQKTEITCPVLHKKYEEEIREVVEKCKTDQDIVKNCPLSICNKQQCVKLKTGHLPVASQSPVSSRNPAVGQDQNSKSEIQTLESEKEAAVVDNSARIKAHLIEVDLSEIMEPTEQNSADVEIEQKNVLGFFFKDEERDDEMAKRRAAFLIKQQRKAEEAKLRKQQQEAESELKRDEARRKAEEERIRKEEEKARREIIKQEYLRRKQEMLMEEHGLVKSLPRTRSRKSQPKSLHRGSSSLSKGATTTSNLSGSHHGSTHSLATEVESIISVESHCAESVCSMESFPVLSRGSSRNMERDWEIGSLASSIISTEYTGPKLFKEPCSKSNKPIIINAIAHCCLAGKVNETQKNGILEELDKCDSNQLIILFRDGGCQFRAIYAYSPDTEEITKVTGTGPRNISHKMIDKLYKYSSDRKQFSVIPVKSVSVSVDALTIHNHLWHIRRPGNARRK